MKPCATVREARALNDYRLELVFSDGLRGVVDLSSRILGRGGLLRALENPDFFAQVRVNSELGAVVWPNEVDFCPDLLRHWVETGHVPEHEPSVVE